MNPCTPSPCGLFSTCRDVNSRAICACLPNYLGAPPNCRPECVITSECGYERSCVNQRCIDPCPGTCGIHARCRTTNHNPICSCPPGYVGDPFVHCVPEESKDKSPLFLVNIVIKFHSNFKENQLPLSMRTPAFQHPADPIPCVRTWTRGLCARVLPIMWVAHQIVDPNASQIPNVHQFMRVSMKNVVTHVLDLVASMLNAVLYHTHPFACVLMDILGILSQDVRGLLYKVRTTLESYVTNHLA